MFGSKNAKKLHHKDLNNQCHKARDFQSSVARTCICFHHQLTALPSKPDSASAEQMQQVIKHDINKNRNWSKIVAKRWLSCAKQVANVWSCKNSSEREDFDCWTLQIGIPQRPCSNSASCCDMSVIWPSVIILLSVAEKHFSSHMHDVLMANHLWAIDQWGTDSFFDIPCGRDSFHWHNVAPKKRIASKKCWVGVGCPVCVGWTCTVCVARSLATFRTWRLRFAASTSLGCVLPKQMFWGFGPILSKSNWSFVMQGDSLVCLHHHPQQVSGICYIFVSFGNDEVGSIHKTF